VNDDEVGDIFEAREERSRAVELEVWELRGRKVVPDFRYLCPGRSNGACLLAAVYVVGSAHLAYLPHYRLAKSVNDRLSTPDGRAAHMEVNKVYWKDRSVLLDPLTLGDDGTRVPGQLGAIRLDVRCRHFYGQLDPADMIANADSANDHQRMRRD
jgi:hypothetical protein